MVLNIEIEQHIKNLFPSLALGYVTAHINVAPAGETLISAIEQTCRLLAPTLTPETIRSMPAVETMRNAYRMLGKDPARYRPSAESLLRRIASGKELYSINNAVDMLNLISIQTGFSICGYDADTVMEHICFRTGRSGEPYEGIGRGILNIENLPVFSDSKGAFGTPTSDSVRTMVTASTQRFLMIFPTFTAASPLESVLQLSESYLDKYISAKNIHYGIQL